MPLEDDAYLVSLVRMTGQRTLCPQTFTVVWGNSEGQRQWTKPKVYSVSGINTGKVYSVSGINTGEVYSVSGINTGFSCLGTWNDCYQLCSKSG